MTTVEEPTAIMRRYAQGEVVDVNVKGARVLSYTDGTGELDLAYEGSRGQVRVTLVMDDRVSVERAAPPEWPPQVPGEMWRGADGELWMYRWMDSLKLGEMLSSSRPKYLLVDDLPAEAGPLRLVYRPEPDGEHQCGGGCST